MSAAPITTISAPPLQDDERGDLLSNKQKLPNGDRAIGLPAPGFSLRAVDSKRMAEIRAGRVTIVNFWATWCMPCMKDLPNLDRIYASHHARGLDVIALSVDDEPTEIAAFVQRHQLRFPVAWDDGHQIANLYQPSMMPTTFLIDRTGHVRFIHGGYHDGDDQKLEDELKDLL